MRKLITIQIVLFVLCSIIQISAQDILLLKVNYINPDGSLVERDLQFEIHDNSKMYFLVNGERKTDFLQLGIQPMEKLENGIEITGYDILSEHAEFDQFGILDMRHMDVAVRKAALGVEYPLVAMMANDGDKESIQMLKAEIVKGEITKNKVQTIPQETASNDPKVTFQFLKVESTTAEITSNQLSLFDKGEKVGTMDIKYQDKREIKKGVFHYYSAEGMGYDLLMIADLSAVDLSNRKKYFGTEAVYSLGIREKGSEETGDIFVKKIQGDLNSIIKPKVTKTRAEINNEFTRLFKSMENGFKDNMKNPSRDFKNKYKIQLAPGNMGYFHGEITAYDNGIVLYSNHMNDGQNEIVEALESYPSSKGYKVETITKKSDSYHFVVKKNTGKSIGFLKLYQAAGVWAFDASLPLQYLESDLKKIFKHAENHFKDLDKTLTDENENFRNYVAKEKINYTVEPLINIMKTAESSFIFLDYRLCDLEAIKYQVEQMDLSFSGYKKTSNKLEKDGIEYIFKDTKDEIITIKISYASNTDLNTNIIIDHKIDFVNEITKNLDKATTQTSPYRTNQKIAYDDYESKEDIIHPTSAPYLPFSGKYEGDDLISLIGRHYKDPAIQNWMNQPGFKVGFTKFETAEGGLVYVDNEANGIELRFREDKLYSMKFYIPNYKKELPLDVTTNPISLDNNKYVEFLSYDNDYSFHISEGHRLRFEVYQNKVHRMTIW